MTDLSTLVENARFLLLGPLAPLPHVRVEGCEFVGQRGAPILKLYLWVEAPDSNSLVRELRVELLEPHKDGAHLQVRQRRNEDAVVALPLDTGGISPRLTVLAHLTRPLPGTRGVVSGRVAAVGRPGGMVRWTPFQCIYRWDAPAPPEPVEAAKTPEATEEATEEAKEAPRAAAQAETAPPTADTSIGEEAATSEATDA